MYAALNIGPFWEELLLLSDWTLPFTHYTIDYVQDRGIINTAYTKAQKFGVNKIFIQQTRTQ